VKLTPSTARTMPRVVVNWVWRSSTANSGAAASGRVFDRPRKFSPASTILKTYPSAQAPRGACSPPRFTMRARGETRKHPFVTFTNAALRSVCCARMRGRNTNSRGKRQELRYGAMPQWRLFLRWVLHRVKWVPGSNRMRRSTAAKCPACRRRTHENIFDQVHRGGGRVAGRFPARLRRAPSGIS
jgi:hypothetical protein